MATALYRRYRPESFADVIGQDHVTTPLKRALRAGRIGHAYLFSGPRGCGKTTSARILARCLNCAEGPTDTPCGTCDSCRDLSRGGPGSLDVVEIDAASHGGVDDARELRERATFAPARDRFKVFIIDEAHMVTSAGFNALLKLVEEPPEHVKFVFATTEPDKVIGTIRSRTHHYPFRLIPPQILLPYLEQVCDAEGVQVGEGVLPLVVRAGGGSARDTMSVLDQLMAGAGEQGLDHATAIALLGFTDTALLDRTIVAVAQRDGAGIYGAVEQVLATGHEPRRFVEDLLERIRDLIVLAAVPDRGEDLLPQVPAEDLAQMREQSLAFQPADLSRCGDLIHETLSTMSGATSPRLHLELLAARLVLRDERASAPVHGSGESPAAAAPSGGGGGSGREQARRIAQERAEAARRAREGEQGAASRGTEGRDRPAQGGPAAASTPSVEASAPPAQPAAPAAAQTDPRPAPDSPDDGWGQVVVPGGGRAAQAPSAAPAPEDPGQDTAPAVTDPAPSAAPAPAPVTAPAPVAAAPAAAAPEQPAGSAIGADAVRGHWSAIMDELSQIRRPAWALVSQNGHVQDVRGSTLIIGFRTPGLLSAFHRGTNAENLAAAVRRVTHVDLSIEAVVGEDPGPGAGPSGPPPQSGPPSPGPGSGGGAPARPAPAREQPRWGSAVDRPEPGATPGRSMQGADRARSASSASPAGRPRPAQEPDYAPEPEDPFPPDPYDEGPGGWGPPEPAAPAAAPTPARSASPAPAVQDAPSSTPPHAPASWGDAVDPAPAPSSEPEEPLVVEDLRRDTVPDGEPRTHGQAALRRAIAEGRVVRTREIVPDGAAQSAPTAPDAPEAARPEPMPGPAPEPMPSPAPEPGSAPTAGRQARSEPEPDPAAPAPMPADAPAPGSPAAAAADWDVVAVPSGTPAAVTPPDTVRPAAAPAAPVPASTEQAASGAELARRAAQASRAAAQERSRTRSAPSASAPPPEPEDPTGGARRDDADATVSRRNGREVIEKMLGGRVLEVIDETKG